MLLRAIFLIAFIALSVEAIAHAAAALAVATLHARALDAARIGYLDAQTDAERSLALAMQQGTGPAGMSSPVPHATCAASDAGGCVLTVTSIAIALASPAPASSCSAPACAIALQANTAVAESRVTFHLSSQVSATNGVTLAHREGDVTFRAFASPPYATLAGSLDGSTGGGGTPGDDGGAATTLVTVLYRPAGDPAASPLPGNVWSIRSDGPLPARPAWNP